MAKKHWIYIKRGLSEDPKHRATMGECIWLYMHIIDRADWDTGIAFDWKDREEAAEMSIPVDTLRRQRQKLEEMDYIRCAQKQHSQDIYIMEWKNPRDYGSETKNPRIQGSHKQLPSKTEDGLQGLNEGLNEGLNQDGNQVQAQVQTPTYSPSSSSSSKPESDREISGNSDSQIFKALSELTGGGLNSETTRFVDEWKEKHPTEWILKAIEITKEKGARSVRYVDSIIIGWEANGYPKSREDRVAEKRNGKRPQTAAQSGDNNKYVTGKYADFIEH
jgi:DnaD/phage-associated family protein